MKKPLPLGSIVRLNNGEVKLMIISRAPLHTQNNTVGYYDYSSCIYPKGQTNEQVLFFNHEDIAEVYFEGYVDEQEKVFQKQYEEKIKNVPYPKLGVK
ncbi:DUF4176 domain-containing protein [Virgibacillus halodenitrificans]|uniref:DUF4176 domain-containing protein n=1 Tax=Virgibacillus halodenitrificans TaxID=1482 RepID=UPI00045D4588|nr:DUF4176 domain-containing protein [Virgibacillus halodenitrificans]MYL55905.1 DUF4176 domain-containing protein [Virgibacillus halodenitrificans]CDQ31373.1 hypothetical protein BN993_00748 [Virgibacillus halodenitrificans]